VYADINGLKMFYEIRGISDPAKVPVMLLHGAISATGTSFGPLPDLPDPVSGGAGPGRQRVPGGDGAVCRGQRHPLDPFR
jgi:hypothetical protein